MPYGKMRVASLPIAMLMNVWGLAFFHYYPSRFEVTIVIASHARMYARCSRGSPAQKCNCNELHFSSRKMQLHFFQKSAVDALFWMTEI
jgi:hypothetical protein